MAKIRSIFVISLTSLFLDSSNMLNNVTGIILLVELISAWNKISPDQSSYCNSYIDISFVPWFLVSTDQLTDCTSYFLMLSLKLLSNLE